ncbi:RNA-directed DNA polymerase, eukaryota [Tanacetum coccineum]
MISFPLDLCASQLYCLEQNKDCLINDRISNGQWCWSWSRPDIGVRNTSSLFTLLSEIGNMVLAPHSDSCVWSLASDGVFSVGITRRYIDDHLLPSLEPLTTWVNILPRKVNIFMWRMTLDRFPHRLNLSTRGMEIHQISCPSCDRSVESNEHIFYECDTAKNIWRLVRMWCDINMPSFVSNNAWKDWLSLWPASKEKKQRVYVVIVSSPLLIWRYRNSVTFNSHPMRKCDIFDSIRLYSFSWLKFRGCKLSSWPDWLKSPM